MSAFAPTQSNVKLAIMFSAREPTQAPKRRESTTRNQSYTALPGEDSNTGDDSDVEAKPPDQPVTRKLRWFRCVWMSGIIVM